MADCIVVPWYATVFRGDDFAAALDEIAPVALRYGASRYLVFRSADDRYRFQQVSWFGDHVDWERYWYGPEFSDWRADHTGWFQVPIVYSPFDVLGEGLAPGALAERAATAEAARPE